ncbi:hypothetical protein BC628DRAFT_1376194 [Trametes gibbosa]|nr:hypothetical protein BC628DRAFT_1376194 [Trametes gibbosa]
MAMLSQSKISTGSMPTLLPEPLLSQSTLLTSRPAWSPTQSSHFPPFVSTPLSSGRGAASFRSMSTSSCTSQRTTTLPTPSQRLSAPSTVPTLPTSALTRSVRRTSQVRAPTPCTTCPSPSPITRWLPKTTSRSIPTPSNTARPSLRAMSPSTPTCTPPKTDPPSRVSWPPPWSCTTHNPTTSC